MDSQFCCDKQNIYKLAFNPLTPEAFLLKMQFLDILEIFRLDIGQISFNVVKKASAT